MKQYSQQIMAKVTPIILSYVFIGISYGILMADLGFAWYWSLFISLTIFSGAYQFAFAAFIASGTDPWTMILAALFMNSRMMFYTLTFHQDLKAMGLRGRLNAHMMADEAFAASVSLQTEKPEKRQTMMFWIALIAFISWVASTVIGTILGNIIPFDMTGIDFSMTALFITIFMGQWESSKDHSPALIGLGCAVIALLLFGKQNFMLPGLIATSAILIYRGRSKVHD